MTKPEEYLLYRLTRTEETYPSPAPIQVGLPGLDVRKYPRLKGCHPFFEDELWFEVGQTRTVPLTATQARWHACQKWGVELRGHGKPVNDEERALIAFCEGRNSELEAARARVLSFTNPLGDAVRAGLVARYLKTAQVGEEARQLRASGILNEEAADSLIAVADRLSELRSDLEAKGWRFDSEGRVWEPSSGGRPARYPRQAIRAHCRQLALQHMASGAQRAVVELIQSDLRPVFGDLTYEEVYEAIKYEVRQEAALHPPAP